MDVYWLEQTEADVPAEDDWLSTSEAIRLRGMRIAKRRADWRLGRWTAKLAVAAYLNLASHPQALPSMEMCPALSGACAGQRRPPWAELANIEIRAAASGAPEVFLADKPAAVTISLSHRAGRAVCAVAPFEVTLGCDLETIEPRGDAFVGDYFTAEEQELLAGAPAADRLRLLALLWSGKESALKALRVGLRLDTRCVSVSPVDALACPEGAGISNLESEIDMVPVDALRCPGEGREPSLEDPSPALWSSHALNRWRPLHVRHTDGQVFHGWWQCRSSLLQTMVAAPPPAPPILLKVPNYLAVQA